MKEEPGISEAVSGIALPGMEKPLISNEFNRFNELKSTQVKRYYEEVMQDHNSIRYCGFEAALNFSQSSEMPVHVEPSKRLLLRRNTINDQIEFFLQLLYYTSFGVFVFIDERIAIDFRSTKKVFKTERNTCKEYLE